MTEIINVVSGSSNHMYYVNLPSAESIMFIMIGIAIWYICVRAFAVGNFDNYITKQISEVDVNLTIFVFCIMLISPVLLYITPISMYNLIVTMVNKGYYMPTIYDSWQFALIPPLYNILGYLFILLGIWCLINIIHVVCLAIDDVKLWWNDGRINN